MIDCNCLPFSIILHSKHFVLFSKGKPKKDWFKNLSEIWDGLGGTLGRAWYWDWVAVKGTFCPFRQSYITLPFLGDKFFSWSFEQTFWGVIHCSWTIIYTRICKSCSYSELMSVCPPEMGNNCLLGIPSRRPQENTPILNARSLPEYQWAEVMVGGMGMDMKVLVICVCHTVWTQKAGRTKLTLGWLEGP